VSVSAALFKLFSETWLADPGEGSTGDRTAVHRRSLPMTVPLAFALSGEGLGCGWGSLTPACSAYEDEFPFDGTIRRVTVVVDDEQREAKAAR